MSKMVLLRSLKRLVALEATTPQALFDAAFDSPEPLEVSVYVCDDLSDPIVQTKAEHLAKASSPPEAPVGALDMAHCPCGRVESEPGETGFKFTREQHRIIRFFDKEELLESLAAVVTAMVVRTRKTDQDLIRTYVRGRFAANDDEWNATLAGDRGKHGRRWRKWAEAAQPASDPEPTGPTESQG